MHFSKPKRMVLREEGSLEKQRSSGQSAIMWTCTASAPEMTIVLYNLSGSPVYHVRIFFRVISSPHAVALEHEITVDIRLKDAFV
mgnify:FL=1